MGLDFRRLAEDKHYCEEKPETCYLLNPDGHPGLNDTFFARLSNGFHAPGFVPGHVDESVWVYRSRKALYLRAPPGAYYYSLEGTERTISGWNYKITWLSNDHSVIW